MRMRSILAGLAALAMSATTANAAIVFNVGDDIGLTHTIDLNGNVGGTTIDDLGAQYLFWLVSTDTDNGIWQIGVSIENTTDTSGGAWSNVTTMALNIDPDVVSGSTNSTVFGQMVFDVDDGNLNQFGAVEFCTFDGNNNANCNNAVGGGGLDPTDPAHTFIITLQLNAGNLHTQQLTFDNFAVRYQSVCFPSTGTFDIEACDYSGTGTLIPEPATWIMMIVGFAGMGYALRYRRRREYGALAA